MTNHRDGETKPIKKEEKKNSLMAYKNPNAFIVCGAALHFMLLTSPLGLSSPLWTKLVKLLIQQAETAGKI